MKKLTNIIAMILVLVVCFGTYSLLLLYPKDSDTTKDPEIDNDCQIDTRITRIKIFQDNYDDFNQDINDWFDLARIHGWEIVQIEYSTCYSPNSGVVHCALITYKTYVDEGG